jgi:hypothetical protein
MRKLLFVSLLLITCSCSTALKIQESFRSEDIDFNRIKSSKIAICGVNTIILKDFIITFNDEYSDTVKINHKIFSDFENQFKLQIPSVKSVEMSGTTPSFNTEFLSVEENMSQETSGYFSNLDADYLLFIDSLVINNQWSYHSYSIGNGMMGGGSTEYCVVDIKVELWNVTERKREMSFNAGGDDTVSFFDFLNTMNDAIENSVAAAVEYIKNDGKIN